MSRKLALRAISASAQLIAARCLTAPAVAHQRKISCKLFGGGGGASTRLSYDDFLVGCGGGGGGLGFFPDILMANPGNMAREHNTRGLGSEQPHITHTGACSNIETPSRVSL